ncbi:hypothetical protein BDN70DRAFT_801784 [Pholiota conissans]|uniref:Uncharacterized protein n=1 Tax=Pholiota conissans TaxID=109636 RepID=A0A9P6CWX1_9AGAR|nr:hypothetical protein BDN70DRAFT_801784 [Pholiota conissans]
MRRRANTNTSTEAPRLASKYVPVSIYSHVSTYRSSKMELQLYSPSLKVYSEDAHGPMAVFGEHDQVGGRVTLDPSCGHTGRLSISIEGYFLYQPPPSMDEELSSPAEPVKHVFLYSATTIALSNSEGTLSRSVFRDAFIKRRPSINSISFTTSSSDKTHPFTFSLPQSVRPGEEMPPTFVSSKGDSSSDYFEVIYKVITEWEPSDPSEMPSRLEVPFILQPDADFQCIDASGTSTDSWLEMPLRPDRPIPVRCAITLPTSVTFSRSSSIPYFVVFTTTPRSAEMAKEIATDATISVSLIRQIIVTEQAPSLPPSPPLTPTSEDSDVPSPLLSTPRPKLLRRVARSQPRLSRTRRTSDSGITSVAREKPLPQIPISTSFSETRTIKRDLCIGFPKRPRQLCDSNNHPSLEMVAALPDGLHKTRIPLSKDMLPCIDWGGISVKYYLDVSVLVGLEDFRARIPIRIL